MSTTQQFIDEAFRVKDQRDELLDALRSLVNQLPADGEPCGLGSVLAARAAIAKAEGKP